jgi:transcriptional regulator with XRE-family HTH domain
MVVKEYFGLHNIKMSGDIRISLGKQLRALRKDSNLTQEALAEKSGISTKYLQNLEGKTPKTASLLTLEKLAKAFGITISQLLKF